MGSCLSTNTSSKHPKTSKISNPTLKNNNISKLTPLEEETVKEVLSETSTIHKSPLPNTQQNCQIDRPFIKNAPLLLPDFAKNANSQQNGAVYKKPNAAFDGYENSEDVSESVTEKRGEKNYEHLRGSSPAKRKNTTRRDNTVGRSPARRFEPSPGRARLGPGSGNLSRDSGEISGRRCTSPVRRMDSGPSKTGSGRSPSTRKTGMSPGRVGSSMGERTRKVDRERSESGDKKLPATEDESLENPLVSMECFIFL